MSTDSILTAIRIEWTKIKHEIETLFVQQWDDPELSAMEYRSSERLANWLMSHGFSVEKKAHGIPTAFIARAGIPGGPVVGILLEYDALPGLDNVSEAYRESLGKSAGHGCGHNHIGPANAGAAIATLRALKILNLKGEIYVVGCPAEEILWGKIALYKAGAFAGIDIILTSHGDYQTGSISRPCQSVVSSEFVFSGQAGHGGNKLQFNALLTAEMAVREAYEQCREKFPNILVRHVTRKGGIMPTITPSEARVWFTTRGFNFLETQNALNVIENIARQVAKETDTSVNFQFITETRGYLPNDVLGKFLYETLSVVGPPDWSQSYIEFMQTLAKYCLPNEPMTLDRNIGYFTEGEDYYGQDDGEISWRIPLGRINWAYPTQIPIHHWAWTALSGNKASYPGPLMASEALAIAAVNIMLNPRIVDDAKDELANRTVGLVLTEPRLGASHALVEDPASFWEARWTN